MQLANDSRKTGIRIQNLDNLAPVNESDVLGVPMRAYDVVLRLPWFHKRNPDLDWAHPRLTALRSPSASGVEEMTPMSRAVTSKVSEPENNKLIWSGPNI
jgi:hypothetical protein